MGTTVAVRDLINPGGQPTKYSFEMVLTLKSKPLGRFVLASSTVLPAQ